MTLPAPVLCAQKPVVALWMGGGKPWGPMVAYRELGPASMGV